MVIGTRFIEHTKRFLARYIASCPDQDRYEVLRYVMCGVIYKAKTMRVTFTQEILELANDLKVADQ